MKVGNQSAPHSRRFKLVVYTAISLLVIGILFGIYLFVSQYRIDRQNKAIIDSLVDEIKLPSYFTLTKSVYENKHCNDVCAHTELTYRTNGDIPVDDKLITQEFNRLTYYFDGTYYSKTVQGKNVHIERHIPKPYELVIKVSL